MSKGRSYHYSGTKGHIVDVAHSLPQSPDDLLSSGWEKVSHPDEEASGHYRYKEKSSGLEVRYDVRQEGAPGFKGKNHYHIMNPNTTGDKDLLLDKNGNPVCKHSRKSHILPKGDS